MFLTKTRLRIAHDHAKDVLIGRMIKAGLYKNEDGRQLYELTLSELLSEWRQYKKSRIKEGLKCR